MTTMRKSALLARVETLAGHTRQTLADLGIPRSTYYRWRQGQQGQSSQPYSGDRRRPWNQLTPEEDGRILAAAAREAPELSSRQLVHHRHYRSRREAIRDITEYIEIFYNRQRRQARLGFLSPAAFERRYYAEPVAA
jgi:transposase InsO family protein